MARKEKIEREPKGRRNRREELPRKRSRFLEGVKTIDVNDFEFLRQFVTEHGKIIPSRLTGASAKHQRQIKIGIRRARVMGLIA
ncbi:MAG: 30S ribosomal protein S18 [Lentisphaerae bacterium]|nr:30S ribosomal protein S18 [Lentisphaerota bacterium]